MYKPHFDVQYERTTHAAVARGERSCVTTRAPPPPPPTPVTLRRILFGLPPPTIRPLAAVRRFSSTAAASHRPSRFFRRRPLTQAWSVFYPVPVPPSITPHTAVSSRLSTHWNPASGTVRSTDGWRGWGEEWGLRVLSRPAELSLLHRHSPRRKPPTSPQRKYRELNGNTLY